MPQPIQESFAKSKGYTVTTDSGSVEKSDSGDTTTASLASAVMGGEDKTVTFTNEKSGEVPTGILMTLCSLCWTGSPGWNLRWSVLPSQERRLIPPFDSRGEY